MLRPPPLNQQVVRHANLADSSQSCLLIVDLQRSFFDTLWQKEEMLSRLRLLIEGAQVLELPILCTVQNPAKLGPVMPEAADLIPGIKPIPKMSFSCCAEQSFLDRLEAVNRKHLVVAGLETHICINQTVHDLMTREYWVHVASDAVSSRRMSDHLVGLRKMEQAGAIISSVEAVLFELLQQAGTDQFRRVLELIKQSQ